jgi:hypothetical protein
MHILLQYTLLCCINEKRPSKSGMPGMEGRKYLSKAFFCNRFILIMNLQISQEKYL